MTHLNGYPSTAVLGYLRAPTSWATRLRTCAKENSNRRPDPNQTGGSGFLLQKLLLNPLNDHEVGP